MSLTHIAILVIGLFGLVAIYTSTQILISKFRERDSGQNPARAPIFINLAGGVGGLLLMALLICLAVYW